MSPKRGTRKPAKGASTARKAAGFTAEERAAMRERARELKAQGGAAEGEADVLAKIAAMKGPDREMATRLHALITASAPSLTPKIWYGMPAYAKDGKVVCYFQPAAKFKARYGVLGFSDSAMLDAGRMWPVAYALTELTPAEEKKIATLVKKAAR